MRLWLPATTTRTPADRSAVRDGRTSSYRSVSSNCSPRPAASRAAYSWEMSMPGRIRRIASALSRPSTTTAPTRADRVWRGTPSQSAQAAQ